MKNEVGIMSAGRRVLASTLVFITCSAVTLWLMTYSFSKLLNEFDILILLLLIVSTYLTLVLIYSIVTIFYTIDRLKGRQKKRLKFLEVHTEKERGHK
jgi:hypothetical protein